MLVPAYLIKEQACAAYARFCADWPRAAFYNANYARYEYEPVNEECWSVDYASVFDGEVIGLIGSRVDRIQGVAESMYLISKGDDVRFGLDVRRFAERLFTQHRMRKLRFTAYEGNPALLRYRRLVERAGGEQVGCRRAEAFIQGAWRDEYEFEIYAPAHNG